MKGKGKRGRQKQAEASAVIARMTPQEQRRALAVSISFWVDELVSAGCDRGCVIGAFKDGLHWIEEEKRNG